MFRTRIPIVKAAIAGSAACAALICSTARAQSEGGTENLFYQFGDDALLGEQLSADGDLIRLRARPARTLLLRPRTQFVGELLKSVEHL